MSTRTRYANDEQGFALPTVLAIVLVMSLVISSAVAYASSSYKQAGRSADWNAALSAAQAGIDDYVARLNRNNNYWTYGNPADPYTHNPSATLPPASDPNPAFTGWVDVPTVDGGDRASYRYEVNSSTFNTDGNISVLATGRAGHTTRSIGTTIRRQNFLDYLYFTDYETTDPALYPTVSSNHTPAQAQASCNAYYPHRASWCTDIQFGGGDTINGDLHTNDAMDICGPVNFNGEVTTNYKGSGVNYRLADTGCSTGIHFQQSGDPTCCTYLSMPPSNSTIAAQVDPTQVPVPGCLYVGPTTIKFNSNGSFDVNSPFTKDTSRCPTGNGVTFPDKSTDVIYVASVPTSSSDPNYSPPNDAPRQACASQGGNPVGYPVHHDVTPYGCTDGDAFVQGVVKGGVTVAAQNNIVVVGDLTDHDMSPGSPDVIGLVANNNVYVYHPVKSNGSNISVSGWGSNGDPNIDAAILSVKHTFTVQNYTDGSFLGTLYVDGAIAQEYRGPVYYGYNDGGQSSADHGYVKQYSYDTRLKTLEPPHFLDPVQTAFKVQTWSEPSAAYAWDAS